MDQEIYLDDSCLGENYSDGCWNCPDENSSRNIELFELYEYDKCMNLSSCYGNSTHSDEGFSITAKIAIYILYNTVFIAAVLGNVLVCYVVFSSPRMRTVTNYLIANLALGDLFMAVLCVPFSYIPVLYQFWPFGQILCHVLSPAQAVCVFVSAYTLVALAGDRYMAILYPLRPRLRRSQAVMVIFFVWIIAILTATPIAIFTSLKLDKSCNPICGEELCFLKSVDLLYVAYVSIVD
ncbi:unnamed protein product [Allacma fusca]|uniref:G-protein coupled receptors family 1 profile domain-containing protein n=1 Tax=Allacma fusca TaxID=39272 RepID=A0A8J2PP57_9HEXA|nr:unnamed protein product [Allacma fusca]